MTTLVSGPRYVVGSALALTAMVLGGIAAAPGARAATAVAHRAPSSHVVAAGAHRASAPSGLSVSLSDGAHHVRPHLRLTYTATLRNESAKSVHATLVLTVPGYVTVRPAAGATHSTHTLSWPVTVRGGASLTRTAAATIGAIPAHQTRVTSLVSVYQGRTTGAPLIRSADADRIVGVADSPAPSGSATSSSSPPVQAAGRSGHGSSVAWIVVLIVVAALVLLGGVAAVLRRRRRATPEPAARPAEPDALAGRGGT